MTLNDIIRTADAGLDSFGRRSEPYIIAEVGVNHEGSMNTARRLIEDAAKAGADAVKFQTYRADTLASKHSPAYWDTTKESTRTQYELFKKYDGFWKKEYEELKVLCDDVGVEFLSTPFDLDSANFLNDLMNVFKIASSDITNKPFVRYLSSFEKPILLSTGAADLLEIAAAVSWIEEKRSPVALMHCILNYPTANENANLSMISGLKKKFPGYVIGYSDHTLPGDMEVLETAWILGARILEKHFTHDKTIPGNDHYHAMNGKDLERLKRRIKTTKELLGWEEKRALREEEVARKHARRSLVALDAIKAGDKIHSGNLTWKRPGHGISPAEVDEVVGKRARVNIARDEVLTWPKLELIRSLD
jgi:N-acetylneuraminate synthase